MRQLSIVVLFGLNLCVLGACKPTSEPSPSEPLVATASASATTSPSGANQKPTASPASSAAGSTGDSTTLFISKNQLLLGEDGAPVMKLPASQELGFASKYKRGGKDELYLVPLGKRLKAERAKSGAKATREVNVIADHKTAYRVLLEVLYTFGQNEFSKYHLLEMKRAGHERTVNAPKPRAEVAKQPAGPKSATALHLIVSVSSAGFTLNSKGKTFASDCIGFGTGVTIPKGPTAYTDLSRCVARIKKRNPTENHYALSAENDTPYGVIIDVIDTMRSAADGTMFADVNFGFPR